MSRAERERPPTVYGDEGLDFNEDSLLDVDNSNSFDLKNELFELKSRCNAIQYEKNKLAMSYEGAIKQLKHKNALLERYRNERGEKEDRNMVKYVNELKYQCQALNEENDMLRRELQGAFEKNRVTPQFNSEELVQEMNAMQELVAKEQKIGQLEKGLKELRKVEGELQGRVGALVKENDRLRESVQLSEQKEKGRRSTNREMEDRLRQISKLKNRIVELDELSKSLQGEKEQGLVKIAFLQQQLLKWQNEMSQVRAALFSEKLQSKKALNALRVEVEEEKNRCRGLVQEKGLENKRLRESILALNDENVALKQRELNSSQKLDSLRKQHTALQVINRQANSNLLNLSVMDHSIEMKGGKQSQYEQKILVLQQQLRKARSEAKQKKSGSEESEDLNRLAELQQDLKYKDEVMQLMKIDKAEKLAREKQLLERIKDLEGQLAQKQKTIEGRQQEIKHLKDDNRYLELGNEELKEKMETLQTVMQDIDDINRHLKKEKTYLDEKRKEQERLRQEARLRTREDENSPKKVIGISKRSSGEGDVKVMSHISKRGSFNDGDLQRQVQELTNENYKLRVKLSSAENEVDRKAMDLNIIRKSHINAGEIAPALYVESGRKNQTGLLPLESKIQELEKEIAVFRSGKKEGEQLGKGGAKQTEEKYLAEIKRLTVYSQQLEKSVTVLRDKVAEQSKAKKEAIDQLQTLQQSSFTHQQQYSETLGQLNHLMREYKLLKQKYGQQSQNKVGCSHQEELAYLKGTIGKLIKNYNEKSLMLDNANDQIAKLNGLLMTNDSELTRSRRVTCEMKSFNTSFVSQEGAEQMSYQVLRRGLKPDYEKSFDPRGSLPATRRY